MDASLEELKARFLSVYGETITREGADDLLRWLTESDFFVAPASTRFHGCHEGGLLRHSLNVYDCLKRNVEQAGLQDTYSPETIAVSALLHDVCKVNFYKKGYRNAKDEETGQWYKIVQNFMHLEPEEILAIRAHMGGWDTAVKGGNGFVGKIFERSKLAVLLHFADMEATYFMEV